jgi:hypothetical protein
MVKVKSYLFFNSFNVSRLSSSNQSPPLSPSSTSSRGLLDITAPPAIPTIHAVLATPRRHRGPATLPNLLAVVALVLTTRRPLDPKRSTPSRCRRHWNLRAASTGRPQGAQRSGVLRWLRDPRYGVHTLGLTRRLPGHAVIAARPRGAG